MMRCRMSSKWSFKPHRLSAIGRWAVVAMASLVVLGSLAGAEEQVTKAVTTPPEVPTVLDRFAPLSVDEAITAFDIAAGFRIELVAAEPLVTDPVAFCFDPAGRMIVVEMRGYSEREDEFAGRVRRLSDQDEDGVMDHAETLVDGLSWPTAVESWPGGVIVGVPPNIIFYPITDDADGKAKVGPGETWFTGFSRSNVQGLMNSFRWGPDLLLHGTASSNGAELSGITVSEPIRMGRQDFAIDPRDRSFHLVTGGVQHGMDFDRWGNKFGTSNSDHLQQMMLLPSIDGRSTRYASLPPFRRSIAADGPAADVYRSSPIEPWRLLRTYLRVSGKEPGAVEGGGRAAGYFTGATGTHMYKGDQWQLGESESIGVVCDVGGNLVHRKKMSDDGLWKVGNRIDQESEFVRSSDTWFRPVQLGDGPDGALYIADMYREVIEHPKSLPPVIKSQVDLNSGNDRGRIWRVVADKQPIRRKLPQLDRLSPAQWVDLLAHKNFWHRRTAARLLVERNAIDMIAPLRQTARESESSEARFEALAVLNRLDGGLDQDVLVLALADRHHEVRRRGVTLAAEYKVSLTEDQQERLAIDPSIGVRFQLALSAPVLIANDSARIATLIKVASKDPLDPWIRWAVEGSLATGGSDFLRQMELVVAGLSNAQQGQWYQSIGNQILSGGNVSAVEQLVSFLETERAAGRTSSAMLGALVNDLGSLKPTGVAKPLADWVRQQILPDLMDRAKNRDPKLATLGDRMKWVRWAAPSESRQLLVLLLSPLYTAGVQQVALVSLVSNDGASADTVIESLAGMTPATGEVALTSLASQVEGQSAIARAIESRKVAVEFLPIEVKRLLAESRDAKIREAMAKHLTASQSPPPSELYQAYAKQLDGPIDLPQGKMVFQRVCASCHEPEAGRERVGPDLLTVTDQPREQILLSVLDPNREVNPKYARVQVVTLSGQVVSGVVNAESEEAVTVVDSQGKAFIIARDDIDELQTSTKSLMPEELNKEITAEQMRHLIAYVTSRRSASPK